MGYRLIALDVDGTIRTQEHPLSDRTRKAIASVRNAGAIVTLATGRMFRSALRASAEISISAPIASSQGAHIADPATRQVLWHRPMTGDMGRAALDALSPLKLDVMGFYDDEVYVSRLTPWVEGYGQRNHVPVHEVGDLAQFAANELTRLVVVGEDAEIQRLEAEMKASFDSRLHVTRSLPHFCEILHPDCGKDKALAWLCNHFGIRQDETIAFGNGYNDVHMLKWAGLGVAVGSAVAEVVAVADVVAPPVEEDGAAQVLESLLTQGLIG
jgi:Cof subfamily protein (haloacid dehalogenase superfamily)